MSVLFGLAEVNSWKPQAPAIWPAVTAGLLSSSAIRAEFRLPRNASQRRLFGVLRKFQENAERNLKEQCGIAESDWITFKVMPALVNVEIGDLADWAKQYLEVQRVVHGEKASKDRRDAVRQIEKIRDDTSKVDERRHLVVQELLRVRSRLVVRRMVRRARKAHGRLLRRRRLPLRMTARRLRRRLILLPEFRAELLNDRIHISDNNRNSTDKLGKLANRLSGELGNRARVEKYKGWVVVTLPPKGGWREPMMPLLNGSLVNLLPYARTWFVSSAAGCSGK